MSLLRSCRFVPCLTTIARIRCSLKGQTYSYRRRTVSEIRNFVRNFSSDAQNTKLDRTLRRLDQDVRRAGRISRRELEEALEELKVSKSATGTQSLLLIRCCGSLLPEEPSEMRTQLVDNIWTMLHNLEMPMDVSHYNALLRVYLENEHPFSPTEFLRDMEKKGIEPNRVTYQRLVERYCQRGDMEGATHILEFMRAKQLPVNEYIFNSLILGHSEAGDMKSASDILNVMKHAGLEPSSETYTTLLCGYAKQGDIESIRTTLEQCKKEDIPLLDQDYMEIIYTLSINDHNQHVDEIIGKFQHTAGFNQDAFNLVLKLTNKKKFEMAKKILYTMSQGARDGQLLPSGTFFIKQLVKANCPAEEILEICKELQQEGLNDRSLLIAIENCLIQGNVKNANILLANLQEQGYSIRQHFFWPMIISCGKTGNSEGILDILRSMSEKFNLVVQEETLREYAIPWLYKLYLKNSKDVISKLRSAGIPLESSVVSLVHYLLSENNIEDAVKVVKKYRINYMPNSLRKPLLQAYRHTGDAASFTGMMHAMYIATENIGMRNVNSNSIDEAFPVLDRFELVGQLLLDTVSGVRNVKVSEVKKLLEAMCSQGLVISTSTAERFVEQLGNANITPEISNLLEKLTSGVVVSQVQRTSQGIALGSESHMTNLVKNLKAKGEPAHTAMKRLLNLHCRNQNLEKANAVWQELLNEGVGIGPGLTAQLIDLNTSNENLATALEVLKWFENLSNDFILNRSKIVKLATLLVKNNDLEGALTLLCDQAQKRTATTEEKTYALSSACRSLLNYLADQADVDSLQKTFDTLLQNNYIDINNVMLGPLIKVHIVRNDLDSAMREFEKLCNKYRCTPMKNDLTCKLIEAEDAVSLQKITDLSTKVHGEVNSLYDLVFAFVECGRVRQARKILETPGLLVRPERVHLACSRYSQEGMVSSLEGLVEATKSLSHIDPSKIYLHLLMTYCQKNDTENALGLWVKMQEENLQPTDEFLTFLGNFLKEQGLPVPFVLPEVPIQSQTNENEVTENETLSNFTTALQERKYSTAFEILESMDEKLKCQVSKGNLSSLLKSLTSSGKLEEVSKLLLYMLQLNKKPPTHIFKNVISQIVSAGDIHTLKLINGYLDESAKKSIAYDNNLCRAYEIAGAASEYLHTLDDEVNNAGPSDVEALAGKFPKTSMLLLLKNHPELHSQFQNICEKYFKNGSIVPFSILWMYHALEHQYSVADEVWNKYLAKAERVKYDPVCRFAYQQLDLPLATYVVERLKESDIVKSSHGYAYSCVIDILLTNGKVEEAVDFVKKSKSLISYENLTKTTRNKLEMLTKERGISLESS